MVIDTNTKFAYCKICGEEKPISEFYTYLTGSRYYCSTICKECKKERVRMLYYLKQNRQVDENGNAISDKKDRQKDLFKVRRGNVVYAKLIWYDHYKGWQNKFVPVIKFDNIAECYQFISIARDLSTADLKRLWIEYIIERRKLEERKQRRKRK